MQHPQYRFSPLERVEELAKSYIEVDRNWKMQARNGMSGEMCIDFWIMQLFMNNNHEYIDEQNDLPTPESLDLTAKECARHYNRDPDKLKDIYLRILNMEFYDPEKRERIERELAELEGEV